MCPERRRHAVPPVLLAGAVGALLAGCVGTGSRAVPASPVAAPAASPSVSPAAVPVHLVGADRDAHGCIGSAGYRWCARTARCERPWELAAAAAFANDAAAFAAYCDGAAP